MRKSPGRKVNNDWYDMEEDWELIESSFVTQYGIRLTQTDMDWKEFTTLLHSLMGETPLGQVVSIRMEEDKERLEHFTPAEHSIRNAWRNKHSLIESMTEEDMEYATAALQKMFAGMV